MTFIRNVNNQLHKEYASLIEVTGEIKLLTALSHLSFEKIFTGDTAVSYEEVITKIELAEWYINSILEGGVNDKINILPVQDTIIRNEIICMQKYL